MKVLDIADHFGKLASETSVTGPENVKVTPKRKSSTTILETQSPAKKAKQRFSITRQFWATLEGSRNANNEKCSENQNLVGNIVVKTDQEPQHQK